MSQKNTQRIKLIIAIVFTIVLLVLIARFVIPELVKKYWDHGSNGIGYIEKKYDIQSNIQSHISLNKTEESIFTDNNTLTSSVQSSQDSINSPKPPSSAPSQSVVETISTNDSSNSKDNQTNKEINQAVHFDKGNWDDKKWAYKV